MEKNRLVWICFGMDETGVDTIGVGIDETIAARWGTVVACIDTD